MKKKLVSLLACAAMTAALMSGCGSSADTKAPAEENPSSPTGEESGNADNEDAENPDAENSDADASGKKFTIGFSDFNLSAEYQAKLRDKIVAYAQEKYGDQLEIRVVDGEQDPDTQNMGVSNLISQQVDLIIMVPCDAQQQIPAVEECVEAGIPLLEVCLQTSDDGLRTTFVGSDDTSSGVLEMECLAEAMGGSGNVVYLHGPSGQDSEIKRHEGANQVLEKYPDIEVVREEYCNWSREEAMSTVENWLQSGVQIDAVFSENDEMALGAYAAIKGTEYEGKIAIGGIDCISDALQGVKDGILTCTVLQDATLQASEVVEAAWAVLNGEEIEDYIEVPYQLVTKENADDEYFNN